MVESKRSLEQRIKDMNRLIADFKIENIEFTPEELEDLHQVALGNKTTEQLREECFAKIARLRQTNPEMFIDEEKR